MNRWLLFLAIALPAGCGPSSDTQSFSVSGFDQHAGSRFVFRLVDTSGHEDGGRNVVDIPSSGAFSINRTVQAGVSYTAEYYVDTNGNGHWDGPVATPTGGGEESWRKYMGAFVVPTAGPRKIVYDQNFGAVPEDFTVP